MTAGRARKGPKTVHTPRRKRGCKEALGAELPEGARDDGAETIYDEVQRLLKEFRSGHQTRN
jgi:hypothetical protein